MARFEHKGQEMDIKEFEKQMQPRAKRSKLEPFQAQIFELKAKGYANWQVCTWLSENGIKVSQEGLRKFIKSRDGSAPASMPSTTTGLAKPAPDAPPGAQGADDASTANDLGDLDQKQRRELRADQFMKSEKTNLLLKRIKDQNK